MRPQFTFHYCSGQQTLEDLKMLLPSDLSTLVDQVLYHWSESFALLRREEGQMWKAYPEAMLPLQNRWRECLESILLGHGCLKSIHWASQECSLPLVLWDQIFRLWPWVNKLVSKCHFDDHLTISLSPHMINLRGLIRPEMWTPEMRGQFYQLTKKFFDARAVMTYKIVEESSKPLITVSLALDHGESYYAMDLSTTAQMTLALPSWITHYQVSWDVLKELPRHPLFEIQGDLTLNISTSVQAMSLQSPDKVLLHFPFFFRPLSIVLPCVGKMCEWYEWNQNFVVQGQSCEFFRQLYPGTYFLDLLYLLQCDEQQLASANIKESI